MAIERKRAEKLLRDNEQQMRSLVVNQGEGTGYC